MQSDNLKSYFANKDKDTDFAKKTDLELQFKTLMQKCKAYLNEIARSSKDSDLNEEISSAGKVTQNVTQSVLIKMQELSSEYNSYKSRDRSIGKYDALTEEKHEITFDEFDTNEPLEISEESTTEALKE